MKPDTRSALADLVTQMHRVVDPNAKTIEELLLASGLNVNGANRLAMQRKITMLLEEGKIERVFKVHKGRHMPAYRDVKKK